jgi:hypothetical protein
VIRAARGLAILDVVGAVGLVGIALLGALRITSGLHVPPDPDLYRSAAITQTMVDGAWLGDPFFAGEWNWYNPLVPGVIAVIHLATGTPVLELYARAGPLLNLLIPLAFWALVRRLFGSGAAAASTFAFLFLSPGSLPGWATAGYWPWLFSGVFTQAAFYAGLLAVDSAGRSTRIRAWVLAGLALGVVFLGHTAPALIFGGVLVLAAVHLWRGGCPARRSMLLLATSLLVAAGISLPVILSVGFRYHFAVVNDVLALYAVPDTEPGNFLDLMRHHATAGTVLAVVGVVLLAFDRERRGRAWVFGYWAAVNAVLLLVHYGRPFLDSIGLAVPQIVTAFHFFLYAEGILIVLAGYGLWRLVELVARLAPRVGPWMTPQVVSRILLVATVVIGIRPALASRTAREDFDESYQRAVRYQARRGDTTTRAWIRANTEPGSVFLVSSELSLYVVAPAGGKVVSLDAVFANPYVDVVSRDRDQFTMQDRIHENDRAGYCAAASRYDVRYVIADASRGEERFVPAGTFLEAIHAADGVQVFRAPDCIQARRDN